MEEDFKKRVLILIARRLLWNSIRLLPLLCAASRNRNTFANWLLGLAYKILVPAAVGSRYGFRDCKFEFLVRRNAPDTGSSEGIIYHAAEGVTGTAKWKIRIKLSSRNAKKFNEAYPNSIRSDNYFIILQTIFLFFFFISSTCRWTWIELNGKIRIKDRNDSINYFTIIAKTLYLKLFSFFFFFSFFHFIAVHGSTHVCLDTNGSTLQNYKIL